MSGEKELHANHRQRMHRRFAQQGGFSGFAEHEVLEYILFHAIPRKDVNPIAHALMDHFGGLDRVLEALPEGQVPTLFLHSDEDYRCPLSEGYQMYAALQQRGVETRMIIFHGENHELSRSGKPRHRIRRLQEITQWFERHI